MVVLLLLIIITIIIFEVLISATDYDLQL